jgi:single-strand DNA-binding protein
MAEGLNRVMLLGNLGADPELRMTSGGQAVLKLRLATSETYMDKNRQRQERTEWHNVVIWGKRAEALAKILTKGSRIFVEGGLRTSSYDDRDGNKRYRTEVVSSNILLQGSGGGARGGGGTREYAAEEADTSEGFRPQSGPPPAGDFPDTDDDDIPF